MFNIAPAAARCKLRGGLLLLSILAVGSLSSCVGGAPAQNNAPPVTAAAPSPAAGGLTVAGPSPSQAGNVSPTAEYGLPEDWIRDFHLPARRLSSMGNASFFKLTPGDQTILGSAEGKLTITVLGETREIAGVTTRVVEEREEAGGGLTEVSRNYFAIDPQTGDVFYFGEEVDLYANNQITAHKGAWLAGDNGNQPGLMMPGSPTVGMKYYQELAPGVAEDRARVVSDSESICTQAGCFERCLLTQESSGIEVGAIEYKTYCPGIGLVQDESLTLVSYGSSGSVAP